MKAEATSSQDIMEFVLKEGKTSTSFLSLYSGFKYFEKNWNGQRGVIAYVDTPTAWVGASDPIVDGADLDHSYAAEMIMDFFKAAKSHFKVAILLPVSKEIAERLRSKGYFTIQIGKEPWFSLKSDEHSKAGVLQKLNVAKQLSSKGARVEMFDPIRISAREHIELEVLTQDWLSSRKSSPLGFLNRLEPWVGVDQKKYFRVIIRDRQVGYLAAVPIHGRKAWYLVDLIRARDAPLGTTELLIAEAMEQLKKQNYVEVSLGMSPLVPVSEAEGVFHPNIYSLMNFVYEKLNIFYNFKPLFTYKEKFRPTSWEPIYLISSSSLFDFRTSYGIFSALNPKGLFSVIGSNLARMLRRIQIRKMIFGPLSPELALRGLPHHFFDFLFRIKITMALIAINSRLPI